VSKSLYFFFKVQGSGFWIQGSRFKVQGSRFRGSRIHGFWVGMKLKPE